MGDIKIGVAGLGHRGRWWVQLLQRVPGYRITAIYDFIEPLHEQTLKLIPYRDEVRVFRDYDEFLRFQGMEAVALTVRCKEQGAMAAKALEAGKHVNAEVPAAHSIEDCWRIVLAMERSGKVYQLAEQVRYAGFALAWRDMVARGELGKVTYCEGQYLGYYGTKQFFQDFKTGQHHSISELKDHPEAVPTWLHEMPPIHYVVHDLSPLMKIINDRPVRVVGMGTRRPSYNHPEIGQPDIQVALVQMSNDTVVRLATGFMHEGPKDDHHWWQCIGTKGRLQWRRDHSDRPVMWQADRQMHGFASVDWRLERADAPDVAHATGHGDTDYYVQASFRDALRGGPPVELDAYGGAEIAATGILAADSLDQGNRPFDVPDFRPNAGRAKGKAPAGVAL